MVHAFRSEHAGKGGSGMASGQAGKGLVAVEPGRICIAVLCLFFISIYMCMHFPTTCR